MCGKPFVAVRHAGRDADVPVVGIEHVPGQVERVPVEGECAVSNGFADAEPGELITDHFECMEELRLTDAECASRRTRLVGQPRSGYRAGAVAGSGGVV